MDLAIVILNWNAATDTIRCVQSIAAWTHLQPAIIVVDNASTDDSVAAIAQACPEAHLIRNTLNMGFAGGNNRGIEAALAKGDAPILLLNNDALISEAHVRTMLEILGANPNIGFIGPLLYDGNDKNRLLAAGSKNPAQHHHSHNHRLTSDAAMQTVECIPGTAIIGTAAVFHTVGLLDEAYFFSSEVADLCLRAGRAGFLNVISTQARVYHTLERSSSFRNTLYPYYIIRNRFLLIRKFHRPWKLFFYSFWTLYSLALSLKVQLSGQSPMAKAVWWGLFDGLQGRFGNQNKRILSKVSDSIEGSALSHL